MPWSFWRQLYLFYHFIPPWPWVIVLIFPWGSYFPKCIITHPRNMSVCMRITELWLTNLKIMISQNQENAGKNLQLRFLCRTMAVFEKETKLSCLEILSYYSHCRHLAISGTKKWKSSQTRLLFASTFQFKISSQNLGLLLGWFFTKHYPSHVSRDST